MTQFAPVTSIFVVHLITLLLPQLKLLLLVTCCEYLLPYRNQEQCFELTSNARSAIIDCLTLLTISELRDPFYVGTK